MVFDESRERWMSFVHALEPVMHRRVFDATACVEPAHDAAAYQGWSMRPTGDAAGRPLSSQPVYIDFGRHLVGRARFRVSGESIGVICVRLGEVPAEVAEDPVAFPGNGVTGGEWLKTQRLSPGTDGWCEVEGRRACRFARLWLESDAGGRPAHARLESAQIIAQSAAPWDDPPAPMGLADWQRELDRVSLHTLRNCMQGVFEDGPKRDRRLWLGDLYLQALTSHVSFAAHDLVKRCLYLFAATAADDGLIHPSVFERPTWHSNHVLIPSYAWLFAPTLRDYVRASGDIATGADLFDIAVQQLTLFDRHANDEGLFDPPADTVWRFIDWNPGLDPQASEQAIAIVCVNALVDLAAIVGRQESVAGLVARREAMVTSARRLYDSGLGCYVSGASRQASWASQAWMTLAGVRPAGRSTHPMDAIARTDGAVEPVTPYMQHTVVAAMLAMGRDDAAWRRVRGYWGGMLEHGATTFWELYDADQPRLSPYGSHLHNSYCHAWSCTPSWFIRRAAEGASADSRKPAMRRPHPEATMAAPAR